MLDYFACLPLSADFFADFLPNQLLENQKYHQSVKTFKSRSGPIITIVGPDLGSNCSHWLPADNTSSQS